MNRRLALVAVLVALAAGLALYLATRGGSSSKKTAAAPDTTARDTGPDRAVPPTPTRAQPDRSQPADPNNADRPPSQYTLEDGTIVRDHRDPGAAPYVRPNLPRREDSPIKPEVTSAVMSAIRPIVLKCMQDVPDSAFGDPKASVVETRASVSIDAAGNLSVLELGPAVSGIDEDASADALDCIRNAAGNVHVHVDSVAVPQATLAFAIRPMYYRKHAQ